LKYEQIGNHILYNCDARDLITTVDLVVTDPPYKLTSGGKNTGKMGGILSTKNYNNNGSIVDCGLTWKDIIDICSGAIGDGHIYIMANDKNVYPMLHEANNKFRFHNLLVWKKDNSVANRWYMKNCEFIGFFYKGKAQYINDMGSQQVMEFPNPKNKIHPTQKPVELFERLILNSSKENQIVYDPFMGAGTAGIACINTKRNFIGCEKDPKYFDIACERLTKHLEGN
jgi:DNA modification methylase